MKRSIIIGSIIVGLFIIIALNYLSKSKTIPLNSAIANRKIELIECPLDLDIPNGEKVECGYLIVPENRSNRDRDIKIFFARVVGYEQDVTTKPLVYLAGGPGEGGSTYLTERMEQFFALRRSRDLIVIDQRGTGFSLPRLDCDTKADAMEELKLSLSECLKQYQQENIDLTGYNTTESAKDLQELRQALKIDRWNLIATSYGTRLAQEVMRIDPDGRG